MKLGKFYEQPIISIIIAIFSVWLILGKFYEQAGWVLAIFSLLTLFLWVTYNSARIPHLEINKVKGNTVRSIMIALVGMVIVIAGSMLTGSLLLGWEFGSVAKFITENKGALIGSGTSPYASSPIQDVVIFGLGFPIAETVVLIFMFSLLAYSFKANLNIKNPRVWLLALGLGFFAMAYHWFAKQLSTGAPNLNALNVIGWIFFVEVLMAVYTKEIEPSIWHHIINNIAALGVAYVTGALYSTWWVWALIILFIIIQNRKKWGITA